MPIPLRLTIAVVVVSAVATVLWMTREDQRNRLVWDHFDVVKPNILYRSGQLNLDQLEAAVRTYGIRTVISFQFPGPAVARERALAKKLGIDFINLPMPGDGFGREEQFREVLAATDDPERRPVLIHCARGTCRTGAAVALYRLERDGWTLEDVAAEMARQTYRHGWLPGYVYGMVQEKPCAELCEPPIARDHNLPIAEKADAR
ncbi:MAG: tyrosine-protein phosphatase [Isosphaeraceae bacterium]|nr:tyrosine-protein phosphatase [Isosphaeraceae bacterium]